MDTARCPNEALLPTLEGANVPNKYMELIGCSTLSFEDAVAKALRLAYQTEKSLIEFHLVDTRASINNGKEHAWQVTLEVGYSMNPYPVPHF